MQARLLALKSAVPPYVLEQSDVVVRAGRLFGERRDVERLMPIFGNTGIDRRYSCVPIDWYNEDHGWQDRTELYVKNAVDLLEKVARGLMEDAKLSIDDIDAIVVSSTTGIATPSLDALVIERMQLRRDIRRLPIFGLGCAGGVTGLSRAADLAKARPGSRVLFLVVELCALTFRKNDLTKSNFVATALFGDGAAGAILSTDGDGPAFTAGGEYTWPDSLGIMGWDVEEDGLKAIFSQSIPMLVANDFTTILAGFLQKNDLNLRDIDKFACHPGGAKVLDALEDAFQIERGALTESRSVLRDYGNMSAVTALFVMERMDWRKKDQRILMTALGPGFSSVLQLFEN
ncbi:MAG TPA: 3-oxoacyl-[acyl-carrier-protein] synthase III C-terminal domain-containing protein [Rhizomicrobium sp.]|nr:3-oxoacyl-[acyl-carrier-protein] synthase III C-terminal domain-containing protein [Rhizomicrobium sp.]